MKVVSSIGSMKHRHPDCQVVKRSGRIYVICKSDPRFKVRQGYKKNETSFNIYSPLDYKLVHKLHSLHPKPHA